MSTKYLCICSMFDGPAAHFTVITFYCSVDNLNNKKKTYNKKKRSFLSLFAFALGFFRKHYKQNKIFKKQMMLWIIVRVKIFVADDALCCAFSSFDLKTVGRLTEMQLLLSKRHRLICTKMHCRICSLLRVYVHFVSSLMTKLRYESRYLSRLYV